MGYTPPPPPRRGPIQTPAVCAYCLLDRPSRSGRTCANCGAPRHACVILEDGRVIEVPRSPSGAIVYEPDKVTR